MKLSKDSVSALVVCKDPDINGAILTVFGMLEIEKVKFVINAKEAKFEIMKTSFCCETTGIDPYNLFLVEDGAIPDEKIDRSTKVKNFNILDYTKGYPVIVLRKLPITEEKCEKFSSREIEEV